jgi:hypothetical protein
MSDLVLADRKTGTRGWSTVWSIHLVAMLWSLPPQAVERGTTSRYVYYLISDRSEANSQRTNASPTCYTFPSPSQNRTSDPVLADFFTGSSSEPGVIMITPEGEIRTWENISLGLGNLDRYLETDLELGEDDAVDKLYKLNVSYITAIGTDN